MAESEDEQGYIQDDPYLAVANNQAKLVFMYSIHKYIYYNI